MKWKYNNQEEGSESPPQYIINAGASGGGGYSITLVNLDNGIQTQFNQDAGGDDWTHYLLQARAISRWARDSADGPSSSRGCTKSVQPSGIQQLSSIGPPRSFQSYRSARDVSW